MKSQEERRVGGTVEPVELERIVVRRLPGLPAQGDERPPPQDPAPQSLEMGTGKPPDWPEALGFATDIEAFGDRAHGPAVARVTRNTVLVKYAMPMTARWEGTRPGGHVAEATAAARAEAPA